MRVGINATKALERETGVGSYTYNLVRALARRPEAAASLRLYLMHGPDPSVGDGLSASVGRLNLGGSAPRIVWEQFGLPALARRDGLALLHYVDHALPLWRRPCPVVITVHDLAFYRLPTMYNFSRRHYKQFVGLRSIRRAARVITPSVATREEIVALAGIDPARVTVIPYGLDEQFRPLDEAAQRRARTEFDLTRPYFLFVGTLQPRKNLRHLIAAFARLTQERGLPHELVLVGGEGWLSGDLVRFAGEHRVADRLRLFGSVPQEKLPALYNCSESLVFPSWYEGFGLPPLEAMACGVPVIASDRTSIPEVVGEAGLLVEPQDVTALAAAMGRILDDEELRLRLRRAGPERARQFSWDRAAGATLDVYRQVCGEG